MEFRDFGDDPAGRFAFEMEKAQYPVSLEAAVRDGLPTVEMTVRHNPSGVAMTLPWSSAEARQFAQLLIDVAAGADAKLAEQEAKKG